MILQSLPKSPNQGHHPICRSCGDLCDEQIANRSWSLSPGPTYASSSGVWKSFNPFRTNPLCSNFEMISPTCREENSSAFFLLNKEWQIWTYIHNQDCWSHRLQHLPGLTVHHLASPSHMFSLNHPAFSAISVNKHLHIGRWICEDGQYNAAEIKTDTDDESKWHVRIACLFVFEATASLLQMDIIPIITAMGNVIMATVTKGYTKPS